jgi:hypothetical protein
MGLNAAGMMLITLLCEQLARELLATLTYHFNHSAGPCTVFNAAAAAVAAAAAAARWHVAADSDA